MQCIRGSKIPRDHSAGGFYQFRFYLVLSGDRLLMVEQMMNRKHTNHAHMSSRFLVLEAADLNGEARWSKVDALMGHALFVSEGCSESLPVGVHGGAREDCIYFMSEHYAGYYRGTELESGIYNETRDCGVAFTTVKDVGRDSNQSSMASFLAFPSWNLTLFRSIHNVIASSLRNPKRKV